MAVVGGLRSGLDLLARLMVAVGGVMTVVTVVSLGLVLAVGDAEPQPERRAGEQFSPEVAELDTVGQLLDRLEEEVAVSSGEDLDVVIALDDLMRRKFLHGYTAMQWYDNWVLSVIHRVVPEKELMGYLDPDEIASRDLGICSQQAILFQHLASSLGYRVGSVRFFLPGLPHFASAVEVDGEWYLFDSNAEPSYDRRDAGVLEALLRRDVGVIADLYGEEAAIGAELGEVTLSDIDAFPATTGRRIQQASAALSWAAGPILMVLGLLVVNRRARSRDAEGLDARERIGRT